MWRRVIFSNSFTSSAKVLLENVGGPVQLSTPLERHFRLGNRTLGIRAGLVFKRLNRGVHLLLAQAQSLIKSVWCACKVYLCCSAPAHCINNELTAFVPIKAKLPPHCTPMYESQYDRVILCGFSTLVLLMMCPVLCTNTSLRPLVWLRDSCTAYDRVLLCV